MAAEKPKPKKKVKKPVRRRRPAPYVEPYIKREPVAAKDVTLVEGTGTAEHGGGPGGRYWHIYVGEERAGYIYISPITNEAFGEHFSVQIFINKSDRGKQIGRVAYRLACEQSGYDTVYAHMRKSNTASMRAAEEAGFTIVKRKGLPQFSMVWRRKQSRSKDKSPEDFKDK